MSKYVKWLVALALLGGIAATVAVLVLPSGDVTDGRSAFKGKGKGKGKGRGRRPGGETVPVLAALATKADVPVHLEGLGTVRALNTVTVQPLVDGRLTSVNFREGQDVKQGDLIAVIDPTLYQAQLNQALAKKAQDEAQLANARRELERASSVGRIATLQKTIDTARAQVAQFEALVKADQAAIDNAAALLGYSRIKAPISGRTGIRMVDEGNVVRASANSAIVVITQVQPISIIFNLPQQQLARVNAAMAATGATRDAESPQGTGLLAEALAPDGRTVVERGMLQVVDNQVDQTTGTVRLKAEFPNAALRLWPGQFVNVRILVDTLRGAVVVPTAAVQQGPDGPFVYAVAEEDAARMRPVVVTQQDDRNAVIGRGVAAGDRVVTTGFARLRDGIRVAVAPAEETATPIAPANAERSPRQADRSSRRRGRPSEGTAPDGNAPDAKSATDRPAATAKKNAGGALSSGREGAVSQ